MKRYLYTAGSAALMFALSGVPLLAAHADENAGVSAGVNADAGGMMTASASSTMRVSLPGEEGSESNQERGREGAGGMMASTSLGEGAASEPSQSESASQQAEQMREAAKQQLEHVREAYKNALELGLMASATPAMSVEELQQAIEQKKQELESAASSTATSSRFLFEHASPVAVAVHALLASKDLMGSTTIGSRISVIAQEMNDSLATTTAAEAQIQARGFWQKLFFGGDTQAASSIQNEVTRNEARIAELTQLLNSASTSAEVKTALQTQITAMQQVQTALAAEAKAQTNLWGIFSWRLF